MTQLSSDTMSTKPQPQRPILEVSHLSVGFSSMEPPYTPVTALENVSFALYPGKTLCLVGESGCGKSVTARSLLRLLPSPPAQHMGGEVLYNGQNLITCTEKELQQIRGNAIGMVFQEPMTSLNPVMGIGKQVAEHIALHKKCSAQKARDLSIEMLRKTGIPQPEARWHDYPHHLSGGMRQRVMIAIAMACAPAVLIADEPTTALDVSIQKQILTLMTDLVKENNSALLLITHDFSVVRQVADYVAVMYAGRIVEQGPADNILKTPLHPYTQGLLAAHPQPPSQQTSKRQRLRTIPGTVPSLGQRPFGCFFHPRCPHTHTPCTSRTPIFADISSSAWHTAPSHQAACWLYSDGKQAK